jgi:hypothetical protein
MLKDRPGMPVLERQRGMLSHGNAWILLGFGQSLI